jgi:hypothetical protein
VNCAPKPPLSPVLLADHVTAALLHAALFLQLLLGLQTSISGELRSCLLDSLSQSSSTPGSASISMSEEEIAAQLATAIAEARKERAAAANEGLEGAIAAGKLAAWVFKAAVGVGALQLVKAGAGMGLERVSVCVGVAACSALVRTLPLVLQLLLHLMVKCSQSQDCVYQFHIPELQ